jgi:hypothetical protein
VEIRGTITRPPTTGRTDSRSPSTTDRARLSCSSPCPQGIDPRVDPELRAGQRATVVGFSGRFKETQEVVPRFRRDLSVAGP